MCAKAFVGHAQNDSQKGSRHWPAPALLAGWLLLGTAQAAPALSRPAVGSPARKAIQDALRGPVSRQLGVPVVFKVNDLVVSGPWAFVRAGSLNKSGKPIGPATGQREVWALLQHTSGVWKVQRWAYPSDVISEDWAQQFPNVPAKLWPHNRW